MKAPRILLPPTKPGVGAKLCRVIGLILLAVGLLEMLVSGFFLHQAYEEAQTWPRATATVTEVVPKESSDDRGHRYYYYPRYTFTAQDGQDYTVLGTLGSSPARHKVGDEIDVIYPADNPARAEINSALNLYFLPGGFAFMAALELLLGAALLVASRVLRRKAEAATPPPFVP